MKIIHTADLHLGSKISSRFPEEISELLKSELRAAFMSLIEYAKRVGASVIILSGDVFDSDRPFKKDTDFFYRAVERCPEIDFIYLRGNHDTDGERRELPNLKTFDTGWRVYRYGDVAIWGIEADGRNRESLYSTLAPEADGINIVMLHGQINSSGEDSVDLMRLAERNIDYLALGHIHSHSEGRLDRRGSYAYPGCLFGRGFDECGAHGFIELTVEGGRLCSEFVTLSGGRIEEKVLELSGVTNLYEAYERASKLGLSREKIYRIILVGEIDGELGSLVTDLGARICDCCRYAEIKDRTERKIDYRKYENELSLAGELVRLVRAADYPEDEKRRILGYGLRALSGKEIEE